ncbi:protein lifeguard 1 isoform X1 [Trichogramma pretiosum]|uniref:protein lifeguard 1 isoform X1 n=2 Tax=Trichogramma pretiosum TaxID=7493 RepID=UPI0006C9864C|nr:protein lifeguard 1 isoform X1 [Trichogramma pretiosum]XP_023313858.1 protein lifeguard 1 isoform X1 [Trichogramma pretiosum]
MANWQNNPGGGFYPGQQGYPPYPPGANPGYPGGNPGYPGGYPPPPGPGFAVPPPTAPYGHVPPQGGMGAMYGTNYAEDPMADEVKGFAFNDVSIRQGFIRKVYSILMLQLLITFGMVALFSFNANAKQFALQHTEIVWICMIVTFVLLIAMACCTNVRRQAPMNFIFLMIFTIAEAVLLGFVSSMHDEKYVLMAVGITVVICFSLTLFAFQTKYDFTGMGTYLFVAAIVLMIFGLITIFYHGKTVTIVYSSFGALLFSFYLVYDTQLMLGGKHKYSLSPEEYIFASLNLYLDIVNIFIYILSILSASSRD